MKREVVIEKAKKFADNHLIDPYIVDVLTDGSTYAEEFISKLSVAENDDGLLRRINDVMC